MTSYELQARKTIEGMKIENILDQFELTTSMTGLQVATVRGWLMDEIEKRYPEAFDKWLDSEDPEDSKLREYIFA